MYFPDLTKWVAGEERLLSWDEVFKALLCHDIEVRDPTLRVPEHVLLFLGDRQVKGLLSTDFPTYAKPSVESRTDFDSRTSSINITPSSSHQYKIEEIKENALWLSKEVDISELEALRLTLLEWQYRPEARLKTGFSDAELASLRDLFGEEYCDNVALVPGSPLSRSEAAFDSPDALHARLLQLYFHERSRMVAVAKKILQLDKSEVGYDPRDKEKSQSINNIVEDACIFIASHLDALQSQRTWLIHDQFRSQIDQDHATSILQSIALALDIIILLGTDLRTGLISAPFLLQYLHLVQRFDHFDSFQSDIPLQQTVINHLCLSSACTTLCLLQAPRILSKLAAAPEERRGGYIFETAFISDIHNVFLGFSNTVNMPSSLGVLSWALLLTDIGVLATEVRESAENRAMQKVASSPQDTRRSSISSTGSGHHSVYDAILGELNSQDEAESLLASALQHMGALDYISQIAAKRYGRSPLSSKILDLFQDTVLQALPALGYSPDLLSTQIDILGSEATGRLAKNFIEDTALMESMFDVAAARFPHEALPFLRLCKSLARATVFDDDTQYVSFRLRQLDSFTQPAVEGFALYHTIREDENANLVSLNDAVGIFDLQPHRYLTQHSQSIALNIIPAQTVGEVISESMPPVIKWEYTYSGFALLGKWIELHREGSLAGLISPLEDPDEVVAELVQTVMALLRTTYKSVKGARKETEARLVCDGIIGELSTLLKGDVDLVGCVFELSEHQVQASRGKPPSMASRDLLAACIDFITVYAEIWPSRAWPLVVRSSIFATSRATRNAMSFIGGIELPAQTFNLLESCAKLLKVTIQVALRLSVLGVEPLGRQGRPSASQRLNSGIISSATEVMLLALEAMTGWTFQDPAQKQRIFLTITRSFYDIIFYAFGTGEKYDSPATTKTLFIPAATSLIQALQNPGLQGTGAGPLLHQVVAAVVDSTSLDSDGISSIDTSSSVKLMTILLQYSQMTEEAGFAGKMLNLLPVLIRLEREPYQAEPTNALVRDILKAIPPASNSSILGHLGAASSISWIDVLRHTFTYSKESVLLWQIYSQLVILDQQWLAIVLITGAPPGRQRKEGEQSKLQTQGKPCLQLALDAMSAGGTDFKTLAGMLEFLLEAQRNWPSVSDSIAATSHLFGGLIMLIKTSNKRDDQQFASTNKVAALVTELAVLHLHRLMNMKDERLFSTFIPLLNWLASNAISIAAYNTSLHSNLTKNFTMKYPMLNPDLFRRSGLVSAPYGVDYFFDLGFADEITGEDPFWYGKGKGGFNDEFERANINLSTVDSELRLLRSLEYLSTEHAPFFARNRDVAHIMAQMVTNCLTANSQQATAEKLFDNVYQTRADLAITLLRPLVAIHARGSEFPAFLNEAWGALRTRNSSYAAAIVNSDLRYFRSCLNIVLLSLQFHVEKKVRKANGLDAIGLFNNMFCEVARLVGEGFKTVGTALQARYQERTEEDVTARDVSLLLNLLQTILRLPTLPQFTVQLSEVLISTGATQSCISLYSWSHLLLENGRPVFGDLAIRCLASLSSLPIVAEDLAVEGILTRLLSAKLTQRLQGFNGVSHIDERPSGLLMYSVWSRGILPICLSLLHGVGGGVASEVSDFLNQFPAQLNQASLSLSGAPEKSADTLTFPLVSELATLSLILHIWKSFRDAGASAGVDSGRIAPLVFEQNARRLAEDVRDAINQDVKERKRRTLPTNEREVKLDQDGTLDGMILKELKMTMTCLGVDLED